MAEVNENKKKRNIAHHLHKQWIATTAGKAAHKREVEKQHKLRKKLKKL